MAQGAVPVGREDAELARAIAARAGDAREHEAELYRRFAPRVRLYGLRHLGDEASAADLVQRVLVIAIEKLRAGGIDAPEKIASFILGTARLTAMSMRRAGRGSESLPSEALLPAAETLEPEPLGREQLARCLEALPERERSVVVLTYFRERRAAEVASELSLSEGNVRVIRHRAIERLRSCMSLEVLA